MVRRWGIYYKEQETNFLLRNVDDTFQGDEEIEKCLEQMNNIALTKFTMEREKHYAPSLENSLIGREH